jgi:hypothetical protein
VLHRLLAVDGGELVAWEKEISDVESIFMAAIQRDV